MYKLPKYISEEKFNQELIGGLLSGEEKIINKIDSAGNYSISFDEITEKSKLGDHLVAIPVEKTIQKQEQIETFFSIDFEEFTDVEGVDVEGDVDNLYTDIEKQQIDRIEEEQLLQAQVDELGDILDKEMERSVKFKEESAEMYTATKDLIITYRIKNGEGVGKDDFASKFPFLPLTTEQIESGEDPDVDQFPFLSG